MVLTCTDSPEVKKLLQSLRTWLNSEEIPGLFVKDIFKDLFVAKLIANMMARKLNETIIDLSTFTTCTAKDFQLIMGKLVGYTEKNLFSNPDRWTLKGILANDYSSLLCFLVDLAGYFDCPFPIPANIILVVTTHSHQSDGAEVKRNTKFTITSSVKVESLPELVENVAIEEELYDQLVDSPEKLKEVCQLLLMFVNNNIREIGIQINDLIDLYNGGYLIVLIGIIGKFFVPLNRFKLTPESEEDKMNNVLLAFQFLEELGADTSKMSAKLFLEKDLKTISRSVFLLQQINRSCYY